MGNPDQKPQKVNEAGVLSSSLMESGMSREEFQVVIAIIERKATDTWVSIAKRLRISRRYLLILRNRTKVRNAVVDITLRLSQTDIPEILHAITQRAKKGDPAAIRTWMELTQPFRRYEQKLQFYRAESDKFITATTEVFNNCNFQDQQKIREAERQRIENLRKIDELE